MQRPWPLVLLAVATWVVRAADLEGQQEGVETVPVDAQGGVSLSILSAKYLHFKYAFEFGQDRGYRQGRGEMYLWKKDDGSTYLHTTAETHSGVLGNTQITMVADARLRRLYLNFNIESMHESQCLWYPFPEASAFPRRMKLLRKRMAAVAQWPGTGPLELQWTKSNVLELLEDSNRKFSGVRLKRGERTSKIFSLLGDVEEGSEPPAEMQRLFKPPGETCGEAAQETKPIATVQLHAAHQRSMALNDFLLVLTLQGASQQFIALTAMALPGDTALLIQDPVAPKIEDLGGVVFNYNATVYRQNHEHKSTGSLWLDLTGRAFRIYGLASHTVLGHLELDFIAKQQPTPTVYANVVLETQEKQQCLFYDYPSMPPDGVQLLTSGLEFVTVDDIDDEDCVIFSAPLARGRTLYVWVDMEQDDLHAILRMEVHHRKRLLRRADIFGWRKAAVTKDEIQPDVSWGCSPQDSGGKGLEGKLAELGIANAKNVHKRSLELLDTLYAVQKMPMSIAILELLALPGDVSMVVSEPELPELWTLPALVFNYTLAMPFIPARARLGGYFATDFQNGLLRMTAGALGTERLDIVLSRSTIDVQITPVADLGKCPNIGFRAVDRCWYMSKTNQNCHDACGDRGLAFDWTFVPDGEPMVPNLLGKQPGLKQRAWGRLECYVKDEDRYSPAQATPDAGTNDTGDPGDWKYNNCELACPCSPMVHTDETQCLSVNMPPRKQTTTSLSDATLWSFDRVGAIGELECNRFSFPVASRKTSGPQSLQDRIKQEMEKEGDGLLPTSVELWYSEEDRGAHRMTLNRDNKMIVEINITDWQALSEPPPMDVLKTPANWNCRSRDTKYDPWLELASSPQVARLVWERCEDDCPLPASAALWQLAEATGVLGLLAPAAQDMLSRLVIWPAGRPTALQLPHGPLVDMMGSDLQAFSFSFSSVLNGDGSPTGKKHGVGEIRVDLKRRRLAMRSEAHNVSSGVPLVESHVIYLGDQAKPLLLLHTQISDYYQQCWSVKGQEETARQGPQANPFARAKHVGGGFSAPSTHNGKPAVTNADKYHFAMTALKNVDLFLDDQKRLIAMNLHDAKRDTTSSVVVRDWDTDPIDEKWFEFNPDWYCADTQYPADLQKKLAEWDLLSFFFPPEEQPMPTASPGMTLGGAPSQRRMREEDIETV